MRMSSVNDCMTVLRHYGVDPARGQAIDVGGTEKVWLKSESGPTAVKANPLLKWNSSLIFLDKGFNEQTIDGRVDECVDFLDPDAIAHLVNMFDMVFCFDTLEHVKNPFKFCEHLLKITKYNGHIYVSTPFQFVYHPSPEDYFRFSPIGLIECFNQAMQYSPGSASSANVIWCGWESDGYGAAILLKNGVLSGPIDKFELPQANARQRKSVIPGGNMIKRLVNRYL